MMPGPGMAPIPMQRFEDTPMGRREFEDSWRPIQIPDPPVITPLIDIPVRRPTLFSDFDDDSSLFRI